MRRKLNITALVDEAEVRPGDPDFQNEPSEPITEYHVIHALRELGYRVTVLPATQDICAMVTALNRNRPDLVFNLTEQLAGDRTHDKNIAALLEMLELPYTGAGPTALMLCRDKPLCKQLLSLHKIRVPGFASFEPGAAIRPRGGLRYPLVVKPALEDSSEGVSNASLVNNDAELTERVRFVHDRWQQPAIAEEYVPGRELYVAILGNKRLKVLPPRECFFKAPPGQGPQLATYRVKWNPAYREKWKIEFGFAQLEPHLAAAVSRTCRKAYHILQIRDYGRIDLRLTPDNRVVVLEANPNPDLAYGEEVAEAAEKAGLPYEKFIDHLVKLALRRYR